MSTATALLINPKSRLSKVSVSHVPVARDGVGSCRRLLFDNAADPGSSNSEETPAEASNGSPLGRHACRN